MSKELRDDSNVSEVSESSEVSETSEVSESSDISDMSSSSGLSGMTESSDVSGMSDVSGFSNSGVSEVSERSEVSRSQATRHEEDSHTATDVQPMDNLEGTEGLLRDAAAPVVVELGRLRFNTSQVIRLKEGQVLRLPRTPADPVDLVVHGKVFAKGELVEIDGELGVRILEITGAH